MKQSEDNITIIKSWFFHENWRNNFILFNSITKWRSAAYLETLVIIWVRIFWRTQLALFTQEKHHLNIKNKKWGSFFMTKYEDGKLNCKRQPHFIWFSVHYNKRAEDTLLCTAVGTWVVIFANGLVEILKCLWTKMPRQSKVREQKKKQFVISTLA